MGLVGSAPLFAVSGALPLWDFSWLVQKGQQCVDSNGNIQTVTSITVPAWTQSTAYTVGNLVLDTNGNTQMCTTAGTSTTSPGPTFKTVIGQTTSDGSTLVWVCVALGAAAVTGTTAPSWVTTLNSTTNDTIGTATGSVTWTLTKIGPIPGLNQPVLIYGGNPNSTASGQSGNFGPLIQGFSIPYALNQIFAQGAGQAIVVNVFDQRLHYTSLSAVTLAFPASGAQAISVGHMGLSSIKVTNTGATTTYVEGADFSVDRVNGVIKALANGRLTTGQSIKLTCNYADPSKLADSDLVGTVTNNVYTGMQVWKLAFSQLGFFPKLLLAPAYGTQVAIGQTVGSQDTTVANGLAALAPLFRAMYFIDCPPLTSPATLIANRGTSGQAFNTSDKRAILCGPQQLYNDTGIIPTGITLDLSGNAVQNFAAVVRSTPYSPFFAGATAVTDLNEGYWVSGSNVLLVGALGPDTAEYGSFLDAASDTNNLNANGIVTGLQAFGLGVHTWGNRSAAFPAYTTLDVFIPDRRTMDVLEQSLQLSMLPFIDQPITSGIITSILASANAFIRVLIGRGALETGSKATYNQAENPAVQISAGQLIFDIDVCPPPPLERLTFNVFIDTTLLAQLTGANQQIVNPITS